MVYDFIIIGGGMAGLSAGMYAGRLNLKTLLFAELPGGLITTTHLVENWPGIVSISGPDLAANLYEHAQKSNIEIKNEKAAKVAKVGELFEVESSSGKYQTKTLLLATGTLHKKMNVPGEKEFENRGVSYCALCDGAFYREKTICIVGGGDSASKEASLLAQYGRKVYHFVRGDNLDKAEPKNLERELNNEKIEVRYNTQIAEIMGNEKVEKIKLDNGEELQMDGVFVAIGHNAQSELAKQLGVTLNEKQEIIINRHSETSIPGVFAAGDLVDDEFKQAIIGSAEGVAAAYYAYKYVNQ